ncbi:hypothetical protein ACIBG0_41810 [Nocardia sp. NPDC050630]|uniref:hypothetical protein n=1 Tax=Nocardia sp. NPDC050630 TaxID=3364321 RepID=UPI0037B01DB4
MSAVQTRFADMLLVVRTEGKVVVTYHNRAEEAVLLIHPDMWHDSRDEFPVGDDKILEPLGIKEARGRFGQLREMVVYDGFHAPITRHGREHAIVVPVSWAQEAEIVEGPASGIR